MFRSVQHSNKAMEIESRQRLCDHTHLLAQTIHVTMVSEAGSIKMPLLLDRKPPWKATIHERGIDLKKGA